MSYNFWLEAVIDAYIGAVARGEDWRQACAAAQTADHKPHRVLTSKGLKDKGLNYSRQHLRRKIDAGTFPAPFKFPDCST